MKKWTQGEVAYHTDVADGLDAVARPRWPLDEAAALANPTHQPGRKGAKA